MIGAIAGDIIACDSMESVLEEAKRNAEVAHNHPEGIRGAQATALSIYLARTSRDKNEIRDFVERRFGYDLSRRLDDIRETYTFDVSCQGSVPEPIIAFLESTDYEDAIRNAISLGGDADTMACIAGGIAEAFFGVPVEIRKTALSILDDQLRETIGLFYERFGERL